VHTVLRPGSLRPSSTDSCGSLARSVRAFDRVYPRPRSRDAPLRRQLGLFDGKDLFSRSRLLRSQPALSDRCLYLPDEGVFHLTEYNAETPRERLRRCPGRHLLRLPVMGPFLRPLRLRPLPAPTTCCTRCCRRNANGGRAGRGNPATPRIAIVDWREVPTYNEFLLCAMRP